MVYFDETMLGVSAKIVSSEIALGDASHPKRNELYKLSVLRKQRHELGVKNMPRKIHKPRDAKTVDLRNDVEPTKEQARILFNMPWSKKGCGSQLYLVQSGKRSQVSSELRNLRWSRSIKL